MEFEIVLAPQAVKDLRALRATDRSAVQRAMQEHLRFQPERVSRSRIKRLRGLRRPQYRLRVDISPARVGLNSLHLFAFTPAGQPHTVVEWKATVAAPSLGIEPATVSLLPIPPDHALGEITFPVAGTWELRFTLRLSDVDQASVVHQITVK